MSVGTTCRSNPFPFLLWIATNATLTAEVETSSVVTLFHFYCGLRQFDFVHRMFALFGSNPFPFLLWIATLFSHKLCHSFVIVVTLFHFYCGLRLPVGTPSSKICDWSSNPFPFLLWIATSYNTIVTLSKKP